VKLTTHLHVIPSSKNEWSYTSTAQGQLYRNFFTSIRELGFVDWIYLAQDRDQWHGHMNMVMNLQVP
jgi:hypothetical protein